MHKNTSPNRKEILKELMKSLHTSDDLEAVKDRFKKILEGVSSVEIALAEEELLNEGMTRGSSSTSATSPSKIKTGSTWAHWK